MNKLSLPFAAILAGACTAVLADPPAGIMSITRAQDIQLKPSPTPVPAGSFVIHHPNKIHWDGAKDEEVIVQIMGVGPGTTTRVDESGKPKQ